MARRKNICQSCIRSVVVGVEHELTVAVGGADESQVVVIKEEVACPFVVIEIRERKKRGSCENRVSLIEYLQSLVAQG